MLNKKMVFSMLSAVSIFSASVAAAPVTEMTKDAWLSKVKEVAPSRMCTSFTQNEGINKQLLAAHISYDQCVAFIPESFNKCQKQFYTEIPATINKTIADSWGARIGDCISTDFSVLHFVTNQSIHPAADAPSSTPSS
jgi:hypothetical protein